MKINYLDDEDLSFLHRCSEEHLETFTRILTHNENGKPRLSSALLRNENFQAMAGHPERYRRNWQLIAGELQHFGGDSILEHSWKKMDDRQKADFFIAVECRVNEHKEILPFLLQTNKLAQGVSHLLEARLTKILRTHAAVSVIGHGLVRGAGLGGPLGAAFNGVKAVSGSAYRVTIPAVLHIACLRQMTRLHQVKNEIGEKYPARS